MPTTTNSGQPLPKAPSMPAPPMAGRPPDPNKIVTPRSALRDDAVEFAQRVLEQSDQVAKLEARAAKLEQQLAVAIGELEASKRREETLEVQLDDRNRQLEKERDYYKARVVRITGQFEVLAQGILDCLSDPEIRSMKVEHAGIAALTRELEPRTAEAPPPSAPAAGQDARLDSEH